MIVTTQSLLVWVSLQEENIGILVRKQEATSPNYTALLALSGPYMPRTPSYVQRHLPRPRARDSILPIDGPERSGPLMNVSTEARAKTWLPDLCSPLTFRSVLSPREAVALFSPGAILREAPRRRGESWDLKLGSVAKTPGSGAPQEIAFVQHPRGMSGPLELSPWTCCS